ncbi:MAG: hypothetical protein Q9182_004285 [Xanthomendoza sp. 2 TL-2023]
MFYKTLPLATTLFASSISLTIAQSPSSFPSHCLPKIDSDPPLDAQNCAIALNDFSSEFHDLSLFTNTANEPGTVHLPYDRVHNDCRLRVEMIYRHEASVSVNDVWAQGIKLDRDCVSGEGFSGGRIFVDAPAGLTVSLRPEGQKREWEERFAAGNVLPDKAAKGEGSKGLVQTTTGSGRGWSRDLEQRGTSWDNGPREGNAYLKGRSTSWDNTPTQDYASLKERGTAWDNITGPKDGKKPDLGPNVGQGGKPQPLYGNGWEPGRRSEGSTLKGLFLTRRRAMERANVSTGGKGDSGKLMPMGGCINCLRQRIKRWVSAPYISSIQPLRWLEWSRRRKGNPDSRKEKGLDPREWNDGSRRGYANGRLH